MPVKKGKGGKIHRKKKKETSNVRELIIKEDEQEYALVDRMLGDGRLTTQCEDGKRRIGIIRGAMRKKIWISAGDYILLSLRSYQDDKADVIHKYNPDEVRNLKKMGHISENIKSRVEKVSGGGKEENEDEDGDDENENMGFIFENI